MSATEKTMKDILRVMKKVLTILRRPYDVGDSVYEGIPEKEKND